MGHYIMNEEQGSALYNARKRYILVCVGVGISRVEVFRTACLMRHCSI